MRRPMRANARATCRPNIAHSPPGVTDTWGGTVGRCLATGVDRAGNRSECPERWDSRSLARNPPNWTLPRDHGTPGHDSRPNPARRASSVPWGGSRHRRRSGTPARLGAPRGCIGLCCPRGFTRTTGSRRRMSWPRMRWSHRLGHRVRRSSHPMDRAPDRPRRGDRFPCGSSPLPGTSHVDNVGGSKGGRRPPAVRRQHRSECSTSYRLHNRSTYRTPSARSTMGARPRVENSGCRSRNMSRSWRDKAMVSPADHT